MSSNAKSAIMKVSNDGKGDNEPPHQKKQPSQSYAQDINNSSGNNPMRKVPRVRNCDPPKV